MWIDFLLEMSSDDLKCRCADRYFFVRLVRLCEFSCVHTCMYSIDVFRPFSLTGPLSFIAKTLLKRELISVSRHVCPLRRKPL